VLTALYQQSGDVEAVIDQLNQSVVEAFSSRMWTEDGAEMGAAGMSHIINRSINLTINLNMI